MTAALIAAALMLTALAVVPLAAASDTTDRILKENTMTLCHRCGAETESAFFCPGCVDRCHEASEFDHSCPVCRTASEDDESQQEWEYEGMAAAVAGQREARDE